jgi:para-aminobenzoate synthetase/4-amino-4-deoxychorismate lyase
MVAGSNLWAAGFISYEAAAGFDAAMVSKDAAAGIPLVWFGLFEGAQILTRLPKNRLSCKLGEWTPSIRKEDYVQTIKRVKEYIRAGDTYQVNYTFPLSAKFAGEPEALLHRLLEAQPGGYAALVETESFAAVSVSPELFFRLDGTHITSRPMKGTRSRGVNALDDDYRRTDLLSSAKERAENLMIVDMIRNDLSRIATPGSVEVNSLFAAESHPTVIQMTSTVSSVTESSWSDIVANLFPCASITGAPKIRTMEIIAELERQPRGLYTGAIGYLAPGRRSQFNVAIRTVQIDRHNGVARYDVGGGVVWDSVADDEYDECRTKAAILLRAEPPFSLLETMRYEPDRGLLFKDRHLRRMAASAAYFGFAFDSEEVSNRLNSFGAHGASRLRLLVNRRGVIRIESTPMSASSSVAVNLALASTPIERSNRFLYHKTTNRELYEEFLREFANDHDVHDVVLFTPEGLVTETCFANIALRKNGRLVTPRSSSGLLPGVLREELLAQGRLIEGDIALDELVEAGQVFVLSALRGLRRAVVRRRPA